MWADVRGSFGPVRARVPAGVPPGAPRGEVHGDGPGDAVPLWAGCPAGAVQPDAIRPGVELRGRVR